MNLSQAPRKTILVVEDDFDIRECVRELLEGEGYSVVTAENGRVALDALHHMKRPGLVLLDLMMPVMDGWTLMQKLREDHVFSSLPVVVVSAGGGRDAPLGAVRFIKKPYNVEVLLSAVREHCH